MRSGELYHEFALPGSGDAAQLAWDRNGETLAVLQKGSSIVLLWGTNKKVSNLDTNQKDPTFLAWSKKGPQLAIGTGKGNLVLCTYRPTIVLVEHTRSRTRTHALTHLLLHCSFVVPFSALSSCLETERPARRPCSSDKQTNRDMLNSFFRHCHFIAFFFHRSTPLTSRCLFQECMPTTVCFCRESSFVQFICSAKLTFSTSNKHKTIKKNRQPRYVQEGADPGQAQQSRDVWLVEQ
jgi:hypothetical protein